jgi:DNA-directed RNA polymerase alpha subunit
MNKPMHDRLLEEKKQEALKMIKNATTLRDLVLELRFFSKNNLHYADMRVYSKDDKWVNLDISVRAYNSIKNYQYGLGIDYQDYYQLTAEELSMLLTIKGLQDLRSCGKKTIDEIVLTLRDLGLELKNE